MRTNPARTFLRLAIVVAAISSLGACATVNERAWANGGAMSQSRAHRAAMNGDRSLRVQRELQSASSPLRLRHREVAYPAFSNNWWY